MSPTPDYLAAIWEVIMNAAGTKLNPKGRQ